MMLSRTKCLSIALMFGIVSHQRRYQWYADPPDRRIPLLNLGYNYDANQNVTVIRDDSKHQRELFQYDALDRLTLAYPNNLTTTTTINGNQSWHHEFGYR